MGRNIETIQFNALKEVASHFRKVLTGDHTPEKEFILFFAHNGTGKTRLSMEFKDFNKPEGDFDTLYFNAFTEDLFVWNNDLENGVTRMLQLNKDSKLFIGLQDLEMETRIGKLFQNYVDINFFIDYENYTVTFSRNVVIDGNTETVENIKISRGEENLFIWCFFIAICEIAIDQVNSDDDTGAYNWVKYIYIDDPISSLDENKAIAVACDLANLIQEIKNEGSKIKTVVSSHHSLFFNVMFNELKNKAKHKAYYLHSKNNETYTLQDTGDVPFFHHIAIISQLKQVVDSGDIYTHHFNTLRSILEKTASFFGYDKIDKCIQGLDDEVLFERALNLFSHGKYSIYDPKEMGADNKDLFKKIFDGFLAKYEFYLPEIFNKQQEAV
ncbi:AAA family ATPase [Aestuariibaculum suncheonense]|uniref:AAA family ATPase n=1 Tax=Aestuariibaculum suncheonense TaxID=1028745 RepID=A0A8J6UIF6_9FLAO|nr:AAA family ATPase [Aestuariibaculum suncheonense]MBD0836534.1 AAA family ATPase [Aestuariibaculum suncheonense]